MNTRLSWIFWMAIALMAAACGPPPKPQELDRLESLRADAYTSQIAQAAPQELDKAEKFYKEALEAWKNDELDRAREYAWLGQRQYRCAEAKSRLKEEQARFDGAQGELVQVLQEVQLTRVKVEAAQNSVSQIQQTITALESGAASAEKSQVEALIIGVEAEREKARGIRAPEFAAGPFNLAENGLTLAKQHLANNMLAEAVKEAEAAKAAYIDAYNAAKPEFDKTSASAQRAEREKALYQAALERFGGNALQDKRGVVVVMPSLFEKGKTTPLEGRSSDIDAVVKIAKDFAETNVIVQGYTQNKGDESKNLTVSQSRATGIADRLVQAGIDSKRITSAGYGEESPRFDNADKEERAKNDRVEVIFVMAP